MITAEIMGGLGNQLYIIFMLISYSLDKKNEFYFEDKEIINGVRKVVYWDNLFSNIKENVKPVKQVSAIIKEKNANYNKLPKVDKKMTGKFMGYFQSFKYFENNFADILKMMKFDEIIDPYRNLYDFENSISMHFRLGDYKESKGYHPVLELDYYKRSLLHMIDTTKTDNWQILYFCEDEDIKFIEKQIELLQIEFPSFSFLRANGAMADWEQMLVMSLCAHNIIANSTFSWWAAYLNSRKNIVCCPNELFGAVAKVDIKLQDRYPVHWSIIEV